MSDAGLSEMAKPGPKKSQATLAREKLQAQNWTQKERDARRKFVETPFMPPLRLIASAVGTTVDIVKQWREMGNWDFLRLQHQMRLTEKDLRDKGMSLEAVHFGCLSLYTTAINTASKCVFHQKNKPLPNFQAMREAIATAAMAEEQVRQVYQWMPTVEQRMVIRELIDESKTRVRDMIKEYIDNNEPDFTAAEADDPGAD